MGHWSTFYVTQNDIGFVVASRAESQQKQELHQQWEACVERSCAAGTRLREVRCHVEGPPPQRAWLDAMSTPSHRLVAECEEFESGPAYSLRLARPGLWGLLDRVQDCSRKSERT